MFRPASVVDGERASAAPRDTGGLHNECPEWARIYQLFCEISPSIDCVFLHLKALVAIRRIAPVKLAFFGVA